MMSPGSSVRTRESSAMIAATSKSICAVVSSCLTTPFTVRRKVSDLRIGNLVRRHNHRPHRARAVQALAQEPLHARAVLDVARAEIVDDGIAEDVSERVFARDVASAAADHDAEFHLPVELGRDAAHRRGYRRWGQSPPSRLGEDVRRGSATSPRGPPRAAIRRRARRSSCRRRRCSCAGAESAPATRPRPARAACPSERSRRAPRSAPASRRRREMSASMSRRRAGGRSIPVRPAAGVRSISRPSRSTPSRIPALSRNVASRMIVSLSSSSHAFSHPVISLRPHRGYLASHSTQRPWPSQRASNSTTRLAVRIR